MECSQIDELLSEYVDGALDVSTREEMERHLAVCARCSDELAELNRYRQAMRNAPAVKAPANFLDKIHQRIETEPWWRRCFNKIFVPMRTKLPLEFAGVLATAVLLLVVFYQHTLVQKRPALHTGGTETLPPPVVSAPGESPPARLLQKKVEAPPTPAPAQPLGETASIRLNLFLEAAQDAAAGSAADKDSVSTLAPAEEAGRAGSMAYQQRMERKPAASSPLPANEARREKKDDASAPAALREKPMPRDAAGAPADVLAAIKEQVAQLNGNVLTTEGPPANGRPLSITIQIPTKSYPFLIDFLQRLGRLEPLPPTLPAAGAGEAEQLQIELTVSR